MTADASPQPTRNDESRSETQPRWLTRSGRAGSPDCYMVWLFIMLTVVIVMVSPSTVPFTLM